MLGCRYSDALDTERLGLKLGTEDCIVYYSFSAFHFDLTGGKSVGKSSLVRRFLLGELSEDYHGGIQSKALFFYFF